MYETENIIVADSFFRLCSVCSTLVVFLHNLKAILKKTSTAALKVYLQNFVYKIIPPPHSTSLRVSEYSAYQPNTSLAPLQHPNAPVAASHPQNKFPRTLHVANGGFSNRNLRENNPRPSRGRTSKIGR